MWLSSTAKESQIGDRTDSSALLNRISIPNRIIKNLTMTVMARKSKAVDIPKKENSTQLRSKS